MAFVSLNPYYYLAFDPGEKTGLATFNEEGGLTGVHVLRNGLKGVIDWFDELCTPINYNQLPEVIICETYRIKDYQYKHNMSKVPTIRVIGVIEGYAYKCGAKFVEQESGAKNNGVKWSGNTVPKGHMPDHLSALGHGVYYLYKVEKKWKIKL